MRLITRKNILKGFTLLELLVVISIMGILIALATASYSTAQKKTRDAKRKGDMKAYQNAFEQYYSQYNYYAKNDTALNATFSNGSQPTDPKGGTGYSYTVTYDATNGVTYCVCSHLEITGSGNATNTTCTFAAGDYFCVNNLQ